MTMPFFIKTRRAIASFFGGGAMLWVIVPSCTAHVMVVGPGGYASLPQALAAVPDVRRGLPAGESIEIRLPSGAMRLQQAVTIDGAHGGTPDHPLILSGAADGSTRLVGSVVVPTRPATSADSGGIALPPGTLTVETGALPIASGLLPLGNDFGRPVAGIELFQGSKRFAPSRWPLSGYAPTDADTGLDRHPTFTVPAAKAAQWAREPALWAGGFWGAVWSYELEPVAAINVREALAALTVLRDGPPPQHGARFAVQNAISELTRPGQFVALPQRHLVLLLPDPAGGAVELAVAPQLLRIDHARNITLRSIAFDRSLGTALVIDSGEDITIQSCAMRQTGAAGVLVSGGARVLIRDSVVLSTAGTGVDLIGGDRASLTPGGHAFLGGIVQDFGLEMPAYQPGVHLAGVGNVLRDSLIDGGDHAGVVLSGNDHQVTGNEIAHVLRQAEDMGAIYTGNDWTQRGTVIADNRIHDLGGTQHTNFLSGIYLDDQASGQTITGNTIVGADFAVVIGGGRDVVVRNNIFAQQRRAALHYDERGQTFHQAQIGAYVTRMERMPIHSPTWRARYPELDRLTPAVYGHAGSNLLAENTVVGGEPVIIIEGAIEPGRSLRQYGNRNLGRLPLTGSAIKWGDAKARDLPQRTVPAQ